MKRNFALMHQILEKIRLDPDSWDQSNWARLTGCGTSYCFAGWACVLSGYRMDWTDICSVTLFLIDEDYREQHGDRRPISNTACELLGLGPKEADALFAGSNSLDDLETMVKNLENGRPITEGTRLDSADL